MSAPSLFVAGQGNGAISADNLNGMEQTCDTFAELRGLVGVIGMQVCARGQIAAGDGLGGEFYWNSTSTGTDDDLTVLRPTGGAFQGRWLLLPPSGGALLSNYANDAAAAVGGVQIGAFYRNGSVVQVRVS